MNRLLRRLLALALALVAVVGLAPGASAADDSPIGEHKDCVYVPEDWNGYEFTFYCPPGNGDPELQHYFNAHARYYVNWSQNSPNAIGYKLKSNQRSSNWNTDCTSAQVDDGLCNAAGQPCPRGESGERADCLNDHDYTGIGEWMRGQDNPGILTDTTEYHLLENIRDNPCDVLQSPDNDGHTGQWRLQDNCPDIRSQKPCDRITWDNEVRDQCRAGHPWFDWQPPDPIDPASEPGCKYTEAAQTGTCARAQIIGGDKVQAPRGVIEPLADVGGLIIVVVFIAGTGGLLLHLYYGIEAYRAGDTVGVVFGRMMWTLMACAGATSVSALLWMVFDA